MSNAESTTRTKRTIHVTRPIEDIGLAKLTEEEKDKARNEIIRKQMGYEYDAELVRELYEKAYGPIPLEGERIICSKCGYAWTTKSRHYMVQCPSCYRRVRRAEGSTIGYKVKEEGIMQSYDGPVDANW